MELIAAMRPNFRFQTFQFKYPRRRHYWVGVFWIGRFLPNKNLNLSWQQIKEIVQHAAVVTSIRLGSDLDPYPVVLHLFLDQSVSQ